MFSGHVLSLPYRRTVLPLLGVWHSYKMLCKLVWRKYTYVFKPMFEALHPRDTFYTSPKCLGQIVYVMTLTRCAASQLIGTLTEALSKISSDSRKCSWCRVNHPCTSAFVGLREIVHLFSYIIPIVQDYGMALKMHDFDVFMKMHTRVVLLFANFKHQKYLKSVLLFEQLLRGLREERKDFWAFLKSSSAWLNEECGEILLSVFGRKMGKNGNDSRKKDIKYCDRYFKMMQLMWNMTRKHEKNYGLAHLTLRKPRWSKINA